MLRKTLVVAGLILAFSGLAVAEPLLQLDILGGTYNASPGVETIIAPGSLFTLYAYLNNVSGRYSPGLLDDWFMVSVALNPQFGPTGSDLGSFVFDGTTVNATSDMTYGNPPLEDALASQGHDGGDLSPHGVFPTYFSEFAFQFGIDQVAQLYDTQIQTGLGPQAGTGMYYRAFQIDATNLTSPYTMHFDLYNTSINVKTGITDIDADKFAPFSHDAESRVTRVPEPATASSLLLGLLLIGFAHRRFQRV